MHATLPLLVRTDFPALRRRVIDTVQVNLGYRCNQSCVHCHVNAGPNRTEEMTIETIGAVIDFIAGSPDDRPADLRRLVALWQGEERKIAPCIPDSVVHADSDRDCYPREARHGTACVRFVS